MVVEKEVGDSGAIEMTIRPGRSQTTSNATLPVATNQAMKTVPQPVVPHDAGALALSPCHRTSDEMNHTNSFVYDE